MRVVIEQLGQHVEPTVWFPANWCSVHPTLECLGNCRGGCRRRQTAIGSDLVPRNRVLVAVIGT